VTHFFSYPFLNTNKVITKEETKKFNEENGIVDRNGKPCEGITGGYYTMLLGLFKKYLDGIMKEQYPNPDERSNEYKKMYFEQGSAHSGSEYVLFNLLILIKTFKI